MSAPAGRRNVRINLRELVTISVIGEVASPLERGTPWRIGQDGKPRALPGTGGIVLSHRVGDPCVGLAADHVEPGVSIRNEKRAGGASPDAPNQALQTYACVGNEAIVVSGRARGARGICTGKHGGIDNVLIDFRRAVMRQMAIGDRVQLWSHGHGMRLIDHPDVAVGNCSPRLLAQWGIRVEDGRLLVPVTHRIPARIMGSGLGKNNVLRGDYDIQLADPNTVRRHRLGTLRFGDIVAVIDADNRFGRSRLEGQISIGIVVHSESTVAGHGPGVVSLLSGSAQRIVPVRRAHANIADLLGIREPQPPRMALPLFMRERRERCRAARSETARDAVLKPEETVNG